jgi:hypothetical protein
MEKSSLKTKFGWRSRGYLPHYDGGEVSQFITARLADSLPQTLLEKWSLELEKEAIDDIEFRKKIEVFLDSGYGECHLKNEKIAEMVQENLLFHADKKYKLYAWVIMPNHIHYLVTPILPATLAEITHSNKSYTAHQANKIFRETDNFGCPNRLTDTSATKNISCKLLRILKIILSKQVYAN